MQRIAFSICVIFFTNLFSPLALAIPAEGHRMMISGPSSYAQEIGIGVFERGGNVVDVAVAMGLSLAVTSPYFASLGGGGFALIKMNGTVEALDFRETAPAKMGRDYFYSRDKQASITGPHSVGVPGIPAGLWTLHSKYGRLKWADLFAGPVNLARSGFRVSGEWVGDTSRTKSRFNSAGLKTFFHENSVPLKPGEKLTQTGLAQALELFKAKKSKGFYEGPVAQDIVDTVQSAGGPLSLEDLKNYKPRWLTPLTTDFEGHKIYLMPPPSSGGILIAGGLKLLEKLKVKDQPALSADEYHLLAEVEARIFRGRVLLGDPDFHKNPIDLLTSSTYLEELAKGIKLDKTTKLSPLKASETQESDQTTHFSVMDAYGHAISITVTLNGTYGSGLVSSQYGIALNNEIDDFTTRHEEPNMYKLVQGPGNDVQGGKRPLSSMSPTLIEKNGKLVGAIGSPGGPRIISGVLQVLYRLLARGEDADRAIQTARLHHQFSPDVVFIDKNRFAPEVLNALRAKGHQLEESSMGRVYVVRIRPDGILEGAFDARGEGSAGGL